MDFIALNSYFSYSFHSFNCNQQKLCKTRIILDGGASHTYIAASLAEKLGFEKLNKHEYHANIFGHRPNTSEIQILNGED